MPNDSAQYPSPVIYQSIRLEFFHYTVQTFLEVSKVGIFEDVPAWVIMSNTNLP